MRTTLTVYSPAHLVPVGTKVSGSINHSVTFRVGVKNVGPEPIVWPAAGERNHPVAVYINFPTSQYVTSTGGQCYPWGPYPQQWGWLSPNDGSYKFACYGVTLQPGQTHWYDFETHVYQADPVTGYITLQDGATGPDQAATIVITARKDTLPVTGVAVRDVAGMATVLTVVGALLLALARRTRPRTR